MFSFVRQGSRQVLRRAYRNLPQALLCLTMLLGGSLLSGCSTTEPENASARPWNSPGRAGSGMPGIITEQRR